MCDICWLTRSSVACFETLAPDAAYRCFFRTHHLQQSTEERPASILSGMVVRPGNYGATVTTVKIPAVSFRVQDAGGGELLDVAVGQGLVLEHACTATLQPIRGRQLRFI